MISKIQAGKADGIAAWHPDRLARNSVDGGQLIYLLDTGTLKSLKFPTFWFENTPQGKFMLNIAFGQSKYYVDNLRENVLRGIRAKLRRGEFPGKPPVGYLNEPKLRTIVLDAEKAPLVRRMFETYADGGHTLESLRQLTVTWGLRTAFGNSISKSKIREILCNPFFTGVMRYDGELYEASHPPLVSKELFDRVDEILHERFRPKRKRKHQFAFLGLLRCEECGCSITAERQKGHHYYRCTKKKGPCSQPYVREEALAAELRAIVEKISLPQDWREPVFRQLNLWEKEEAADLREARQSAGEKIGDLNRKLDRLLDAHLEGALTREEYAAKKGTFLGERLKLQGNLDKLKEEGRPLARTGPEGPGSRICSRKSGVRGKFIFIM